ncbi:VanZ family protein [Inhella inkyongensis]|uniref:VanZ family protein n=1 Tax=Inhella inkyongensis TaxID=392593 RepID=A0A840SCM9_9BURK|nr:VanZ family protein [Inhella inkyongensis]MBB5206201.1 VanZ family protein [Inhella inkyongensis]
MIRARTGLSSTAWLALGYAALIAYASLYPFGPWEWPASLPATAWWRLAWPRYWIQLDIWANALGYVPLGFLLGTALWRHGRRLWVATLLAILLPALLAYGMEVLQYLLPRRVPSLGDLLLNAGGGCVGALMAAVAARSGALTQWAQWRERWFRVDASGGLALLLLWPLGLLFPTPLPLALGQFLPATEAALGALLGEWAHLWPLASGHRPAAATAVLITALGLLAPCVLMLALARPGWHRPVLVIGAVAVGVGVTSLSAVFGFGPQHAWSWTSPQTLPALGLGAGMALLMCLLPARANAVLALPVFTALLLLVNGIAADAYWEQTRAAWQQGSQFKLYGLLQWLGWWWPLLALSWLTLSLTRHDQRQSRP